MFSVKITFNDTFASKRHHFFLNLSIDKFLKRKWFFGVGLCICVCCLVCWLVVVGWLLCWFIVVLVLVLNNSSCIVFLCLLPSNCTALMFLECVKEFSFLSDIIFFV